MLSSEGCRGRPAVKNTDQAGVTAYSQVYVRAYARTEGVCNAAQMSRNERSSRLYQGFHRDQVLKELRWNDYVRSEGPEIKITSLSVAWSN